MQRRAQAYAKALAGNDLPALLAVLCDKVRVQSPVGPASGIAAVCRLFSQRHTAIAGLEITGFTVVNNAVEVSYRCRLGDREVEASDVLRFGAGGRITAIAMQMPPLQALALMPVAGSC